MICLSPLVKQVEINFKDLNKVQLDTLKDVYIESRLNAMSEIELRKFAREVLDLQVRGTVGNEEEREVWKEMKDHFQDDFEHKIKEVVKVKGSEDITIEPEKEDFLKRLELLEQRQKEESKTNEDMWGDD